MTRDWIRVTDIVVYGRHGVSAAEQEVGRLFEVDVEVGLDLSAAAGSDDLTKTVDYGAVCEIVRQVNEAGPYHLLEAMAGEITKRVLAGFPVAEVTVRVRKPQPPVGSVVGAAEVEITRERS